MMYVTGLYMYIFSILLFYLFTGCVVTAVAGVVGEGKRGYVEICIFTSL